MWEKNILDTKYYMKINFIDASAYTKKYRFDETSKCPNLLLKSKPLNENIVHQMN